MSVATLSVETGITPKMAAKKTGKTSEAQEESGLARSGNKQINIRVDTELHNYLEKVSNDLGLDISGLVRMIIKENLAPYAERAAKARAAQAETKKNT